MYACIVTKKVQEIFLQFVMLIIAIASLTIAILTYLRVSRKYVSKTVPFEEKTMSNEEMTILDIEGQGSFQRLEMTADVSDCMFTLVLDDEVVLEESFYSLHRKRSPYLRVFDQPNPLVRSGYFAVDMNLQKNFFKNLKFSIMKIDTDLPLFVEGSVHYNIYEN